MSSKVLRYTFSYSTEKRSVDFDTLIPTQYHLGKIFREIHQELHYGIEPSIRLEPFQPGSFEVSWVLDIPRDAIEVVPLLFQGKIPEMLSLGFNSLAKYLELRKFLSGKKPDSVTVKNNKTIVSLGGQNHQTETNVYNNIYLNNPVIDRSTVEAFMKLGSDDGVSGLSIAHEEKVVFKTTKAGFEAIAKPNPQMSHDNKEEIVDAELELIKPAIVDAAKYSWLFRYRGSSINMKIRDKKFLASVDQGQKFGHGDFLKVKLRIVKGFDEESGVYTDKSHEVLTVVQMIPRASQGELGLED